MSKIENNKMISIFKIKNSSKMLTSNYDKENCSFHIRVDE
jgi:hypothetical protein